MPAVRWGQHEHANWAWWRRMGDEADKRFSVLLAIYPENSGFTFAFFFIGRVE